MYIYIYVIYKEQVRVPSKIIFYLLQDGLILMLGLVSRHPGLALVVVPIISPRDLQPRVVAAMPFLRLEIDFQPKKSDAPTRVPSASAVEDTPEAPSEEAPPPKPKKHKQKTNFKLKASGILLRSWRPPLQTLSLTAGGRERRHGLHGLSHGSWHSLPGPPKYPK